MSTQLEEAQALEANGDFAGAIAAYAAILAQDPSKPGVWYLKALAERRVDRSADAWASLERAIEIGGEVPQLLVLRTLLLHDRGDQDGAERTLERLIYLQPGAARAYVELGSLRLGRGRAAEATKPLERAIEIEPGSARAWALLGRAYAGSNRQQEAEHALDKALQIDPRAAHARHIKAELLAQAGRIAEARREYHSILSASPESLRAALGAHLLLPPVYESSEHVAHARAEYASGLERLYESASLLRFAGPEDALAQASWTNFYLAYQGADDVKLQARYADFVAAVLAPVVPEFFEPLSSRGRRTRIRVGFMTHFFVDGTIGRYFSSWVTRLDKRQFEVFVYHTHETVTAQTQAIALAADTFRHLAGHSVYARAKQVRADDLDILVYPEQGMHNVTFLLGALRLAPVQCAAWGHPDTTGHANMDWFISCAAMEPVGAESSYRERLTLLPGIGTHYGTPRSNVTAGRAELSLPERRTLYLVPQSLFKIHPDNDALVAEVLSRDRNGVAVLFVSEQEAVTRAYSKRLGRALSEAGVSIEEQVRFLPRVDHATYLRVNELCDVMLDTLHWSGGNTSIDALARGLPLVTLPGPLMRARQSAAMLGILGAPELVASNAAEYVDTAVRLGQDRDERRALRERLLEGNDELFERLEPVRALEAFLARAAAEAQG